MFLKSRQHLLQHLKVWRPSKQNMAKSRSNREKDKKKSKGTAKRVFMQYFFLWPTLRTYYSLWVGYFRGKKKKAEKEKIVVIED
jgi:hypothetical protein